MLKFIPLACALLLFTLPAMAQGVDQIIHGSEGDPWNDGQIGEKHDPNQDDLYNAGGKGAAPGGAGGGDDGPIDDEGGAGGGDDGMPPEDNAPVPEPTTGLLLGAGMLLLARIIHKRSKAAAADTNGPDSGTPTA